MKFYHNTLFNDSIKKKKILNDLQQKYLAVEAKKYTFKPMINHINNFNKIQKKINNKINKTSIKRKYTGKQKILNNKNEIFNINNTFISNGNKNESYYNDNNILNTINDIGNYYSKNRKNKIINTNNNFGNNRNIIKSVKNSNSSFNKNKKNQISKLILDNFLYPINTNEKIYKNNSKGLKENINNYLGKYLNINKFNKNFEINNDLFKLNLYKPNNLYSSSFISTNNTKLNLKYKPPKNRKNTAAQTTNRGIKTSIRKSNSNQKSINISNRLNNYLNFSLPGTDFYFNDNGVNINLIKNNTIKKNNKNYNNFNNLEITRNVSDCFSLLFNNYLENNKNKIPIGIKSIEIKKVNGIKSPRKPKLNIYKNNISNREKLFNNKISINDKYFFNSINFDNSNNVINKIDFNNNSLFKNKKETLYSLFNINKNKNEMNYILNNKYNTLNLEKTKENNFNSEVLYNKKKYPKIISNKIVKNKLLLNNNIKTENFKKNNFKIVHNSFSIISQKNNNSNKLYQNIINSPNIMNKKNYINIFRNNDNDNIYEEKKYKTDVNNCIYKTEIKKIQKNNINKNNYKNNLNNKYIIKENIIEINDINKNKDKNKEINNKEINNDQLSTQSLSDSKIYELATNYMNIDEFIDNNQIKNILSTKKSKNI